MQWFRTRLLALSVGWLASQLAVSVGMPMALGTTGLAAAIGDCDCPADAPGAFCPMHESPSGGSGAPRDDRSMRSACAPSDAALLSLGLGLGILPAPTLDHVERYAPVTPSPSAVSFDRAEFPDSPPPRV
jgi:hypothetical protein